MTTTQTTSWSEFGPDTEFSDLPPDFQTCLTNMSAEGCDTTVGNALSQTGFCGSATYQSQSYCACVNNSMPCPQLTNKYCANNSMAYRPQNWATPLGNDPSINDQCKTATLCINSLNNNGSNNIMDNVSQQCGTIDNISAEIQANPMLVITLVICIILCIISSAITLNGRKSAGSKSISATKTK